MHALLDGMHGIYIRKKCTLRICLTKLCRWERERKGNVGLWSRRRKWWGGDPESEGSYVVHHFTEYPFDFGEALQQIHHFSVMKQSSGIYMWMHVFPFFLFFPFHFCCLVIIFIVFFFPSLNMLHPHYQKKRRRRRRRRKRLWNACDPTHFLFPIISSSLLAMPILCSSHSSSFSSKKDNNFNFKFKTKIL